MVDPVTGMVVGGLASLAGGLMSKPTQYNVGNIMQQYRKEFDPARDKYNQIGNFGAGLLNMDSDFNRNLQNQFSTMAADRLAQNNRMNTSNALRFGGLSGMVNAQNNASGVGFAQAGLDAFNNAYKGNMGIGMNALNTQASGLMGIGQNIADTQGSLTTANTDMMNNWRTGLANNMLGFGMNTGYQGLMNYGR